MVKSGDYDVLVHAFLESVYSGFRDLKYCPLDLSIDQVLLCSTVIVDNCFVCFLNNETSIFSCSPNNASLL